MTTLKHLLSDKFVEFSAAVSEVHKEIKDLTAEFQTKVKALREKADTLRADFETWEKEQEAQPGKATKTSEDPVAMKSSLDKDVQAAPSKTR